MRQLKGKVKETPQQKKERKKEFRDREGVMKIAIPILVISALVIFLIVYVATNRPKYWSDTDSLTVLPTWTDKLSNGML